MVAVGLLDKAREMKKWLIEEEGIPARSQPKLELSKTGYAWLHRWRIFYNNYLEKVPLELVESQLEEDQGSMLRSSDQYIQVGDRPSRH